MTRYITNEVQDPIVSNRRDLKPMVVPPFSFVGELEVGISGFWYPPSTFYLQRATVVSNGDGTDIGILNILKEEPLTGRPLVINQFNIAPTEKKKLQIFDDILFTPYDKVYIASWVDSGHTGVVIQMTGGMG